MLQIRPAPLTATNHLHVRSSDDSAVVQFYCRRDSSDRWYFICSYTPNFFHLWLLLITSWLFLSFPSLFRPKEFWEQLFNQNKEDSLFEMNEYHSVGVDE